MASQTTKFKINSKQHFQNSDISQNHNQYTGFVINMDPKVGAHALEQDIKILFKEQDRLKKIALKQFCNLLKTVRAYLKDPQQQAIYWGDEIEGHFLDKDQQGIFHYAKGAVQEYKQMPLTIYSEYGRWMFETVPSNPYFTTCNLYEMIQHLREKYECLKNGKRRPLTIPCVPLLGINGKVEDINFVNEISGSDYVDDSYITPKQHYRSFNLMIRLRFQQKMELFLPLFNDTHTDDRQIEKTEPQAGVIHLDSMVFGGTCSSFQTTFSTRTLDHARELADQLNILGPVFLAMTAGTPFMKGKIQNQDVRWKILSYCGDDRTPSQRDPNSPDYLSFSRFSSTPYYLSNSPKNRPDYNDVFTGVRQEDIQLVTSILEEEQVAFDDRFINHLAYLSRRDFLVLPHNTTDENGSQLIELLIATSWTSSRVKLPGLPLNVNNLWKVEFRTMEVQLTADQNAAFGLATYLIARLIQDDPSVNLYLPISQMLENYKRAQAIDAVFKQKFFFRTNIHDDGLPKIEELTAEEIFFGKGDFKGLFSEMEKSMEKCIQNCPHTAELIDCIKNFLRGRATGQLKTLARWQRDFVDIHPNYGHNSILSQKIINDLLNHLCLIEAGEIKDPHFAKFFPDLTLSNLNKPPHPQEKCRQV